MCGIFGYVGVERSVPQSVGKALKSLEYRGYDSWGMVWKGSDLLTTVKDIGKVPTAFTFEAMSRIAVGHTRWATHGGVTQQNAHPHLDASGQVAIVHNGIVENAGELRQSLGATVHLRSETDSEVIAHLLGREVSQGRSIVDALRHVFPLLHGQNAVIAIDQRTELIAAAMNVSPLVIGMGKDGTTIASDPFALAGRAETMIVAPADSVIQLDARGITAFAYDGTTTPLPHAHLVPDAAVEELGDYEHFMRKEMAQQPEILRAIANDPITTARFAAQLQRADHVVLTGCGSAYFAARLGAIWLNTIANKPAIAIPASEFGEALPFMGETSLVVAISQSGETADILDAMRQATSQQSPIVALTNGEHSSAARLANDVVLLNAGRERSVLSTKTQLAMLGHLLAAVGHLSDRGHALSAAADAIANLEHDASFVAFIASVSDTIAAAEHVYVVGKGSGHGVALEAALKIKEASYVHAEAFAAGELKHGAIALIETGSPCLIFSTDRKWLADTSTSAQEVQSRGGYTVGIGNRLSGGLDLMFDLEDLGEANVLVQIFVAQSIAYRVARNRQLDPDYPRNLAKSVTVK